jgi:FG-GAP-like repeat/Abnormal spindle-like microcephaly-assoc'd, ASPM-SPD-2-Hydin/FG-GAP repeat
MSIANAQFETRVTYSTSQGPTSIAVGDFNGDGKLDVAVAAVLSNSQVSVLLGNGDGTFQSPTNYQSGSGPISIAAADLNGDGKLDLAVANEYSNSLSILIGNGDGTFQPAVNYPLLQPPSILLVADFNGDGIPDIAAMTQNTCNCISILLGGGDGTFQPASNQPVNYNGTMAAGDFNGDGKMDIVVSAPAGLESKMQVMLGNGDGTFRFGSTYSVASDPVSITSADFNRDGKLDIAIASAVAPYTYVFLGNGDGTFDSPGMYRTVQPSWVIAADVTGDGIPDLIVANLLNPAGVNVFPGNGDGTFGASSFYPAGFDAPSVAVGDFNGDGKLDLIVPDYRFGQAVVLLNTGVVRFTPTTPLTFATQLIGTTSASQAVTLTNSGTKAMSISSMKPQGPFGMSSTCGKSLAVGASCSISATFSPKTQGSAAGTITISDSASSKPQVIELAGAGTVVKLTPAKLNFGTGKVGSKSGPQTVQMTNVGGTSVDITKIQIAGNDPKDFSEKTGCSSTLASHGSCTFTITFDPQKTGSRAAALQISDSGGGSPQTVQLGGTGD